MKAPDFAYCRPGSLDEVFDLLDEYGDDASLLAGGQTLLATLNMRLSTPRMLIDLGGLRRDLAGISKTDDTISIGALATHDELMQCGLIKRELPLLAQAIPHVAHAAIRNLGTFGGSLALADPAAEYPCCAVALGGQLVLASRGGVRRVAADEFFLGLYHTAMQPGEVLIAAEFKALTSNSRSVFLELARRHGDYAIIGIALHGSVVNCTCHDLRVVYLAAGDRPQLARHVATALEGAPIDAAAIERAQMCVARDIEPPDDLTTSSATKLHLARVLTARALKRMQSAGAH